MGTHNMNKLYDSIGSHTVKECTGKNKGVGTRRKGTNMLSYN